MALKKKRTFFESAERWFRLFVIYMAKDMTLKNPWALFLGSTAAIILTWLVVPALWHAIFYQIPVLSPVLQHRFAPARFSYRLMAYLMASYYTYVLMKPFCRGLVVTHPSYFNEGSLR